MLVIILFLFFRKMYERTFFRFKSKECCKLRQMYIHTTILFQWENFVRSNHNYKKDIFYKLHMLNIKKILIEMR